MEETYISGKEAAKMLGVSYTFLYKLIERGDLTRADEANELKAHQPLRFHLSEVQALKSRTVKKRSSAITHAADLAVSVA